MKTTVWVVNSSADEQRYVTTDKALAEEVRNVMAENRDSSETEYYVTKADLIESVSELSKFDFIDAEKEDGEVLIYFYKDDGNWFRTYTTPERADAVLADLPQFTKWEVKEESS